MTEEMCIRCLCAFVQSVLSNSQELETLEYDDAHGATLRLPAGTLESDDGYAVGVDVESDPGFIVYTLVPVSSLT